MKKYIASFLGFSLLNQLVVFPVSAAELSLSQQPLQVTEYVEPNVMLLLDTSGSMATVDSGSTNSRLQIMKNIATNLVQDNQDIRFCLARFRFDQGGRILSECGSSNSNIQDIVNKIATLPSSGSTPMAEAYYEVINYFAGKTPKYVGTGISQNNGTFYATLNNGKYVSPVQYRCQKNYAIVLTDGQPQLDSYFPGLPSSSNTAGTLKDYNIYSNYSDEVGNDGNYDGDGSDDGNGGTVYSLGNLGVYYFLDDIAKYAWDTDLRKVGEDGATTDLTGASFDDGDYTIQNLNTYTVGFTLAIDMLRAAAHYGEGGDGNGESDNYFNANNEAELTAAFQTAIEQIVDENRTTTEATASSDLLSTDTNVFQTQFTSNQWTGELIAYEFVTDVDGNYSLAKDWGAPASFPTNWVDRVVDSGLSGGVPLKWNKLTAAQKLWFDEDEDGDTSDGDEQRLNYILGKTAAAINSSNYRTRDSLMGDIVNSSPLYIGPLTANEYNNTDLESSYLSFVSAQTVREGMIYVGANDGLLHAFDSGGNEKMAFAPSKVIPNMLELSQDEYSHLFYVDGTPSAATVYAEFSTGTNSWRTVLVGGLRRGGQGIYALDVTEPSRFENGGDSDDDTRAAATFLWEFSDDVTAGATANDKYAADVDLGFSYSEPQIMRLNDGNFYVVLGNGYNSTQADGNASSTGDAVLYLLNIATGEVFKKISTAHGMTEDPNAASLGNGLATVKGFDGGELNNYGELSGVADGKIDYIYAGDLFGNLWKFDLSSSDTDDWDYVAELDSNDDLAANRNPIKLFTAVDGGNNSQPITSQIEAVRLSNKEIMLYFGTGKLLEQSDAQVANISTQTFYGIVDSDVDSYVELTRSDLLEQSIYYQQDYDFSGITKEVRLTTDHTRSTQKGWFIDMKKPIYDNAGDLSYENEGEQIIVGARFIDNYVFFVTNISNQDACLTPIEKNYLMILSARSGAALANVVIDTNEDGTIDKAGDNVTLSDGTSVSVSGRTGFGTQLPIIIKTDVVSADGSEDSVICDANNKCHKVKSPVKIWTRLSWEEIRTQ